jgi:hypothetical protein
MVVNFRARRISQVTRMYVNPDTHVNNNNKKIILVILQI